MELSHIRQNLDKVFVGEKDAYSLEKGANDKEIIETEKDLHISFPPQVKLFYEAYNGLIVKNPKLEIYSISKLQFTESGKLEFAIINEIHPLFFDTTSLNHAGEWNIVAKNNYLVTMTMASFWSNKIWAWVRNKRAIWEEEYSDQ